VFGNGIQNRIIVFLSCLVDTGQDKIKKKSLFYYLYVLPSNLYNQKNN
jgi:hypothetical protein